MVVSRITQSALGRARLLQLARKGALIRPRDAAALGVHSETLTRMTRSGELERVGPGRYRAVNREATKHHAMVLAAAAIPSAVICLLSALSFHNIGTQLPHQVWVAVPRGTRIPRLSHPPLKAVRISPSMFSQGIERHQLEG